MTCKAPVTNKPTSNILQAGRPSFRPIHSVKALKGTLERFGGKNFKPTVSVAI